MHVYPLSPILSAALSASHIAVSEEGDIILSPLAGGALAIGRVTPEQIDYLDEEGQEPDRDFQKAVDQALVPYALDQADWEEIHELWALGEGTIWLWPDGGIVHLRPGLVPGKEWSGIACIRCAGPGQIDSGYYAEGWTTFDDESREYVTEDGRRLSFEEMIKESIREGQWIDFYADLRQRFIESAERF